MQKRKTEILQRRKTNIAEMKDTISNLELSHPDVWTLADEAEECYDKNLGLKLKLFLHALNFPGLLKNLVNENTKNARLERKAKLSNDEQSRTEYDTARNVFVNSVEKARADFYTSVITEHSGDQKNSCL